MLPTKWTSWIGLTADEVSSLTPLPLLNWRGHQPSYSVTEPRCSAGVTCAQATHRAAGVEDADLVAGLDAARVRVLRAR